MPLFERFRSATICIDLDIKNDFEERSLDVFSTSWQANFLTPEIYQAGKSQAAPQLEYFGKGTLNRECAHGKTIQQIRLHAKSLSVQCYKELVDMGWRRDGTDFYKACQECCHTYALRLDPKEFNPSKNQRKILNRLADFFKYGEKTSVPATKNPKKAKTLDFSLEAYIQRIFESLDAHKLEVRLVRPRSTIFNETFEESFQLFQKYYESIHMKKLTKDDFEHMMVKTPLRSSDSNYGTFHKQYLIDGKLIGVEMFDVLPGYIIAQASFYDTDLMHLNLGTFMMLNEIAYAQKLAEKLGKSMYYSTGLYMHAFKKHHYKLLYATEILCIDSATWVPLDKKVCDTLEKGEKVQATIKDSPLPTFQQKPEIFSKKCHYNGKDIKFENLLAEMDLETEVGHMIFEMDL